MLNSIEVQLGSMTEILSLDRRFCNERRTGDDRRAGERKDIGFIEKRVGDERRNGTDRRQGGYLGSIEHLQTNLERIAEQLRHQLQ
jgi:hypothetical protein